MTDATTAGNDTKALSVPQPVQAEPDSQATDDAPLDAALREMFDDLKHHPYRTWLLEVLQSPSFGLSLFKWILTAVVVGATLFFIWLGPSHYTPPVQVLFSAVLFLLAYWIGTGVESEKVRRQANAKWLPQAEAVIYRLMTLFANVAMLGIKTRRSCTCACCELPELKEDNMRAVRVRLRAECEASADRLDDIASQLEDAVEEWRRLVSENCQGNECHRIFQGLQQRKTRIEEELRRVKEAAVPPQQVQADQGGGCGPS